MGVPKFFRYISERYPCLSEVVREYQIPEFDNMYLDMNGIIHMCSHPDDNNPHFRITEERIFQDIFHYIEVLFRMIRPQKLFFMAIDGVAPRAKMNQQRGRRFRSAKDADKQEAEAKKKGEILPTEARFDSNCITPGTVFMARLHEQLKYFCTEKISNDPLWRNVKIILSGHETPGEGEHKIMDYIRYLRAQPGYDPNTRHCLYGLDADLIMLGLCTHEPHFSLLREEVKFGKKSTKRQSVPEEITFFLLHLSLMREYLELEFAPVKDKLVGFEYDFEKIIDDWVLMGFLVGNDFIPHLPHLHIANGALPILYKAYMEVLPTLDGYINEAGTLNLERFEKFMQKLANFDIENFEEIKDDLLYMEAKTGRKFNAHSQSRVAFKGGADFQDWFSDEVQTGTGFGNPQLENGNTKSVTDSDLELLIRAADELDIESDEEDEDDDDEDKAFTNHKREYYMNKLEYENVTPQVLRDQAEGYVRAIQWNLNYYYNGVCSWSWYYPHHYAPYISDIKGFADLKLEFDLGTPFKPYEQLLAVLPAASKELLPKAYHHLMTDDNSPIIKYYPEEFQTDKNGKRQEWEAVVLIPFIDEKQLLDAMKPCNELLTPEEQQRNEHGPMLVYTYSDEDFGKYEAPEYFPPVKRNHAKMIPVTIESIRVPKDRLVKGAYPGVSMDLYYPGFPTFKHLKYTGELKKAKVKVFEQPSRYENMIIRVLQEEYECNIPVDLLGSQVFVGWPHLIEAKIVAMSNVKTKYISMGDSSQYNTEEIESKGLFQDQCAGIIERYKNRLGIECGDVRVLCHVQVLIGRKYVFTPNGKLTLEKQFSEMTANYPLQTIVTNIEAYDSHRSLFKNIQDVFSEGEICFTLSNPYYGAQGIVVDSKETHRTGRIKVCVSVVEEPNFEKLQIMKDEIIRSYKTLFNAASQLGMSHFLYSRITGSVYVEIPDGEGGLKNVNVGLDLKFNKKNKETPGYTRKIATTWYYTDKCTELVRDYTEKFPEIFIYFSEHGNEDATMEDIFGDDWEDKHRELQQWLKSIPTFSMERQPCGSQVTEPEIVEEIEKIIDNMLKNAGSKKVTMTIKPSFLYKPELQSGTLPPDPKMQVQIFDRIVNTRKGFSVPFGLKGTVIAITESPTKNDRDTMFDVVFDKPFKDGLQLNCSPGRGYRLPRNAFIDISYGKRLLEQKAGKEGSLLAMAESGQKTDTPWHATNGQKFFNQYMYNTPSYRQIPDQYNYYHPKPAGQEPVQESAFAPFSKTRGFHNTPMANLQMPENPSDSPNYKSPKIERKHTGEQENGKSTWNESLSPFSVNNRKTSPSKDKKAKSSYDARMPPEQTSNTDAYSYKKEIKPQTAQLSKKTNEPADTFVPKFVKREEDNKRGEHSQPKVLKEIPLEPKNNHDPRRPVVNTGFLKKLLKIDSQANEGNEATSRRTPPEAPVKETSSNLSFEMLAHVANSPASVRLLTYYQSNGLGIPRYQYFQTGSKYKAQITLTNGDLVMSEPADTKEEATEKVASEVLRLLMSRGTPNDIVVKPDTSKTLPVPPKTWVEPSKEKSVDRDSDEALKAALHNPFVPTQVIKRQISKTGNTAGSQKKGQGKQASSSNGTESRGAKTKSANNDENKALPAPAGNSQKKRQKNSRIAANFAMK